MPKRFIYPGNNQKGFDVYETVQDNVYILKPDSTFASNMHVLKMAVTEKKKISLWFIVYRLSFQLTRDFSTIH
jgi:hypothetical protein